MSAPSIVLVDDEPDIRATVREYLELHGYRIEEAGDGAGLRALVDEGVPMDLVILDVTMPGEDGLSVARYLRETTDVAIVMLTAAGDVLDRIIGLEMGADDYLAKPVDLRELLARVKAVLRRSAASRRVAEREGAANQLGFAGFMMNLDSRTLVNPDGEVVTVTTMEFDLLRAFAENPNRVLTRDQLLELAHHRRWEPFDRSIDIRVGRIRRKIERDPGSPALIKTVHGVGYVFAP